jgi:AraC-like DNA-binding protein
MKQPFYQSPLCGDTPYNVLFWEVGPFDPHWYSEIELIYVARGDVVAVVAGKNYKLSTGKALLVGSAEVHGLLSCAPGNRVLVVEMGSMLLGKGFQIFTEIELVSRVIDFTEAGPEAAVLHNILQRLMWLRETVPDPADRKKSDIHALKVGSLLFACAAELLECLEYRSASAEHRRKVNDMLAMYRVFDYVSRNFAESIDVETAAKMAGYEKTRFCQLFKRAIGIPFHHFHCQCRVEEAKRLLIESDMPISAIAESVGFSETKTFSRVFKSITGQNPTDFRNGCRGEKHTP